MPFKEIEQKEIKSAFERVKNDIFSLGNELYSIKHEISELKIYLESLNKSINDIKNDIININFSKNNDFLYNKNPTHIPTDELKNQTNPSIPTDNPTHPLEIRGLKYPNLGISTGNRGVPTDRQTNRQIIQHILTS